MGDAYDKLNRDILDPVNEAWKTAWKGKTSQTYRMLKRKKRKKKNNRRKLNPKLLSVLDNKHAKQKASK
eukprot:SAG22_NODE_1174_length_5252_cov_177.072579_5_plen_69_part_00